MSGGYLAALIALAVSHRLTAGTALAAYFAGIGAAAIWTLVRMRPSFRGASRYVKLTLKETRRFGLNIYLSRIAGQASTRVDQLVIAYFIADPAPLGIYAIVQKFANPIAMIGRSLAATRFRTFARVTAVPSKVTRWNAALLIIAAAGLVMIGPLAIKLLFPQYVAGVSLVVPFAIASLFIGLFQPYNIFLASHGRGVELRNIVIAASAASIIGLTLSVPRFGLIGAAWTGAAVMALDYLLHLYYYRKFRRTISQELGG
jgi:O-antigen/teichoic acid export membrane protein